MFLGGEGETGKSRVAVALLYFPNCWNRPGEISTSAPTGIAASLINGTTVHSMLKLKGGLAFNINKAPHKG